jgi:hypothetical protein
VVSASANPSSPNSGNPVTQAKGFFLTPQEVDAILNQAPTQTLSLGNGKSITIPNPNFIQLQETLGPNGVTELAVALLKRMQIAMAEAGASPEMIAELSLFASKAHSLSEHQKVLESALADYYTNFNGKPFDWSKVPYSTTSSTGKFCINCFAFSPEFSRNADGELVLMPNRETRDQGFSSPIRISSLSLSEQIEAYQRYANVSLQGKKQYELDHAFNLIANAISWSDDQLNNEVGIASSSSQTKSFNPNVATWLDTKINANKTCFLSRDAACLK